MDQDLQPEDVVAGRFSRPLHLWLRRSGSLLRGKGRQNVLRVLLASCGFRMARNRRIARTGAWQISSDRLREQPRSGNDRRRESETHYAVPRTSVARSRKTVNWRLE